MSADNYNWIDYHPNNPRGPWSVTTGFASDSETPTPHEQSDYFPTAASAIEYAASDWTEYGEQYSEAAARELEAHTEAEIHPEQIRSLARLLLQSGDITPQGARLLDSIADKAESK